MNLLAKYEEGFGERIRAIRKRAHLNQGEFGQRMNLSRQSVNSYEMERLIPSRNFLEKLYEAYGVRPYWLLYGIGEPMTDLDETVLNKGLGFASKKEQNLTPAQMALIEFIKSDKEAAQRLATVLWEKALNN